MKLKFLLSSLLACGAFAVSSLRADLESPGPDYVYLSFSGGDNSQLTVNFETPLAFVITANAPTISLIVEGLDGPFTQFLPTTTLSFSINDGPSVAINRVGTGYDVGVITADDAYFFNNDVLSPVSIGDRVNFVTGAVETMNNYIPAAPADGWYHVFLSHGQTYGSIVANATAVPEASSYALWASAAALGVAALRRRKRA